MTKSKIIILLMFVASVSSAFASTVRPAHSSSATRRNNAAQESAKASSCPFKTAGAHNQPSPMSIKNRVAGILGIGSKKTEFKDRKSSVVR